LFARLGVTLGQDVFSEVLESTWRALPKFEWRSSLRTWLYTMARHAASAALKSRRRKEQRMITSAALAGVGERVRTETAAHLRTEVKDKFRQLREQLDEDEQMLLVLRVDSKLPWRELARVMAGPDVELSNAELDTHSARLRQRFQSIKDRLRALAEAEGLIDRDAEA
jgi:RNA polymerase sigma-70 factor (ECF subfamily)